MAPFVTPDLCRGPLVPTRSGLKLEIRTSLPVDAGTGPG